VSLGHLNRHITYVTESRKQLRGGKLESDIGVDLAEILGTHTERRMWVGAEWGEVWEGCPLPSRLGDLGERCEFPQQGPPKTDFGVF